MLGFLCLSHGEGKNFSWNFSEIKKNYHVREPQSLRQCGTVKEHSLHQAFYLVSESEGWFFVCVMFFPLLHCVSLVIPLICLSPVFCSLTEENTLAFFQSREHSYFVSEIKTSDLQPEQFREAKLGKHLGAELNWCSHCFQPQRKQ